MSDNNTKGMTVSRRQFLLGSAALGGSLLVPGVINRAWAAGSDAPELKEIRVGFIPLTDCASVVMAAVKGCLLYTFPSPRGGVLSRMLSSC